MRAFYEFKFSQSRLSFLQGDYASAFDSLAGLEKEVAVYLHQPSILDQMWHYVKPEDFAIQDADSLGTELHVKIGLGLAEIATYMGAFSEAVNIVTNIRTLYSQDSTDAVSARCFNAMGAIFASQGMTQKGEDYFLRSLDLASGRLPEDFVATVYANLSACYVGAGNPRAALKSAMGSYGLLMQNDLFGEQYVYALFYMGIAYVGLGEYDMAEKQFREALNEATSRDFGHLSLYIRSNLVYVLVERGDLEEAGLLAEKNLVSAIAIDNLEMQENALVYLSHIAAFREDFRLGRLYMDSAYHVGVRLAAQNNELRQSYHLWRLEQYRKFQSMERTERQVELLNSELRYKNVLVKGGVALGSLLVLLVVVLYWGGVMQYRRNQLFRLRLDETAGIHQDRIEDMREDMDKAVSSRDKELTAQALYDLKIRGLISSFAGKLREMKMHGHLNAKEKLYVVEMEHLLDDFSHDKELNEFELYFKRVGPGFWEKLDRRFPHLQPHDKRLCAFIYLRLSSKEIASITHRAVRSVYTAKNRLKKKLGLAQDADLYDFLHSLQ